MLKNVRKDRFKIALVWPKGYELLYLIPLPLAYLKANIDENLYEVQLFDNAIDNIKCRTDEFINPIKDFKPDLVGVSTWSPMFPEALDILRLSKELFPNVVTIMGGAHVTAYYKKIVGTEGIDFLMRGEGELSFPIFLDELQKESPDWSRAPGLVYPTGEDYHASEQQFAQGEQLDQIKLPDYTFINLNKYVKAGYRYNCPPIMNAPIWATRGCPYRCQYCAAPDLNGRPVRTHSIKYMLDWIKVLYHEHGVRWFNIIDDNFTFKVKYAKEFCQGVIDMKLKDIGFGTPNGIRLQRGDPELWKLMKQAGWETLIVAPESGSETTLELMKKDLNLEIVPGVVEDIKNAGLKVQAFFIIGYPGEKPEDLVDTTKLIKDCKFNFVFLSNFQPLPGTPVYDELVLKKEIQDGLLPNDYTGGIRAYTSDSFENFNFSKYILKIHLLMMWNYPQNIPYQFSLMFKLFSPHLVVKRFLLVLFNMLTQKKSMGVVVKSSRNAEVPIIHGNEFDQFNNPLHKQGQATS